MHIASMILQEKNGTQQIRKTPAKRMEKEKKEENIEQTIKVWDVRAT